MYSFSYLFPWRRKKGKYISVAEEILAKDLRKRGIRCKTQIEIGCYCVDILLPESRIIVEVDGPHHLFEDEERRRIRDETLRARGYEVIHVSTDEIYIRKKRRRVVGRIKDMHEKRKRLLG